MLFYLFVVAVMIILIVILSKKMNLDFFQRITTEEMEDYQRAVFIHIDSQIEKYKDEIKEDRDAIAKERTEIEEIKKVLLEKEKVLDEKIMKIENYKALTKR